MEKVAFRGDWFDAGLGMEALDLERLPAALGVEIEHALVLDEEGLRLAAALWAWLVDRQRALWSRLRPEHGG